MRNISNNRNQIHLHVLPLHNLANNSFSGHPMEWWISHSPYMTHLSESFGFWSNVDWRTFWDLKTYECNHRIQNSFHQCLSFSGGCMTVEYSFFSSLMESCIAHIFGRVHLGLRFLRFCMLDWCNFFYLLKVSNMPHILNNDLQLWLFDSCYK